MTQPALSLLEALELELRANSVEAHRLARRTHLLREAIVRLRTGEDPAYVQAWLEKQERPKKRPCA